MKLPLAVFILAALGLLGSAGRADAATFANTTSLSIPNPPATGAQNPASPASLYPSSIVVSGLAGTISKVTITLHNLSHQFPDDIDMLLVSPAGAKLVLFSDVGGSSAVNNVTITLDDAAASLLPDATAWTSGTFKPTAENSGISPNTDNFPSAPALSSPGDWAAPFGSATFASQFNGANPNGTWSLYIVDDKLGDSGTLAGGWDIAITTLTSAAATTTTMTSSLNPSFTTAPNNSVTLTATVTSSTAVTVGTVTFKEGATVLASGVALNGSGQASFTTTALTEGNHTITAQYNGDPSFATSNGSVTQTVDNHTAISGNTYRNPGNIAVPDPADVNGGASSGSPGRPYPSRVFVSGLSGSISKITVAFANVTHAFPDDIDILLVAPGGEKMVILSDVGGGNTVSGINLTLDDAAASLLPDAGALVSGTFKPTAVNSGLTSDSFPSPAPAGPYNLAAPFGVATLASVFNGASPNGTWSLYVVDDKAGDVGAIAGGWSLTFTTTSDQPTTTTVASSLNPSFATSPNNAVTFTATVTSSGSPVTVSTVTFQEGATVLGGPTALNGSGQATLTLSALAEGSHLITAYYNGSPGAFNLSQGSITQTVDNHTVVNGHQFSNPGSLAIPGIGTGNDNPPSPAAPYPSHVFVSGLGTPISKLTVTLTGLSHAFPDDIDVLLVGPTGERMVLLSDVGGSSSINNLTLTLDDAAASSLPDAGPLTAGTFRPTAINSGITADSFPGGPALSSPADWAAPFGTATFASKFNGTNPNGTWSLYVVDDKAGDIGAVSGGWSLTLVTPPAIVDVTATAVDGAYRAGQVIPITVSFDQPVTVLGTPQLTLATGASAAVVDYTSGSGSSILTFNYTVAAGHTSSDLDYLATSALALNGGSIKAGTLDAILALPPPGGAGSLGANKNIVVDTTAPTVTISAPSLATTAAGPVTYDITYTDDNFASSSLAGGDLTLDSTETATGILGVTGSGNTRTVTISSITGHGTLGITLAPNTAVDLAGNQAPGAGPSATFIVNHLPVATADTITRYPTEGVKVLATTLLANDTDADGDVLSLTALQSPSSGQATVTQKAGWIVYTPNPGFKSADTFTYTVSDTRGGTATGTVTVSLTLDNAASQNQLSLLNLGGGTFRITFNGIPGRTYTIQYTTDLNNPNWQPLGTAAANPLGLFFIDDPAGSPSRFYRSTEP